MLSAVQKKKGDAEDESEEKDTETDAKDEL
jgi:hypothetical protein